MFLTVDIQKYMMKKIGEIFGGASPTDELYSVILNSRGIDLFASYSPENSSYVDPFYLKWIYPQFLNAIQNSVRYLPYSTFSPY